jgi:hypothetical protein
MNREAYMLRLVDKQVEIELETFGCFFIEVAKWCGKTWTSEYHSKSAVYLGDSSDNFQNKELTKLSQK